MRRPERGWLEDITARVDVLDCGVEEPRELARASAHNGRIGLSKNRGAEAREAPKSDQNVRLLK